MPSKARLRRGAMGWVEVGRRGTVVGDVQEESLDEEGRGSRRT